MVESSSIKLFLINHFLLNYSSNEFDMKRIEQCYDVPFSAWSGGQDSVYKEMEGMLKTKRKLLLVVKTILLFACNLKRNRIY